MNMLILLLSLIFCHQTMATVYEGQSTDGAIVYSDEMSSPSKSVEITSVSTTPSSDSPTNTQLQKIDTKKTDESSLEIRIPYTTFEWNSPKDQESIQNQSSLIIKLTIKPTLKKYDVIEIIIDGIPLPTRFDHEKITIPILNRGSHQMMAKLIDPQGNVLAATSTITIYIHKASGTRPAGRT